MMQGFNRTSILMLTPVLVVLLGFIILWLPDRQSARPLVLQQPVPGGDAIAEKAVNSLPGATGTLDEASQSFDEQVALRFNQGVYLLQSKRYEDAVAAFHQVLRLEPKLPEGHVNMGYALLGLQKAPAAADFFATATEIRSSQANAYYGLAEALEQMDDLLGAMGAMRTYLHFADPNDTFRAKARAALWEWEQATMKKRKEQPDTAIDSKVPKKAALEYDLNQENSEQ